VQLLLSAPRKPLITLPFLARVRRVEPVHARNAPSRIHAGGRHPPTRSIKAAVAKEKQPAGTRIKFRMRCEGALQYTAKIELAARTELRRVEFDGQMRLL
jgi:hypothetical protein